MGNGKRIAAAIVALTLATGAPAQELIGDTIGWKVDSMRPGGAFDPARIYASDFSEGSMEEVVLTVGANEAIDYVPAYSLAIAYRCFTVEGKCRLGYEARTLRVAPPGKEHTPAFALRKRLGEARTLAEAKRMLDTSHLEWLEADVGECPGALAAMEGVRTASWSPDRHYGLAGSDSIWIDPAIMRVTMRAAPTEATYEGWVLADGVPAAVRKLVAVLDPCWKPGKSKRPWER